MLMDTPRPTSGDLFVVEGQREPRTVKRVLLAVSSNSGPTRFVVESEHGAYWALVPFELVTGEIHWMGRPLPADPAAADDLLQRGEG